MGLNLKFKKIICAGSLATAALLTGCGGSGDAGNAPEIPTFAPTVEIKGSNRSLEREITSLRANADDIDGSISSYEWAVDHQDVTITGGQGPKINFTAPSVDEDTVVTFKVTVTDNDGEIATDFFTFTTKAITQELFIAGTAIDEEIINADIVINVGDQEFETTANSTGGFYISIDVNERNFNELVKITAFGQPDIQPGVKLISLLTTFEKLVAKANTQNQVGLFEDFNVNVTNLSTAKYFLAQQLAKSGESSTPNEVITAANYDEFYAYFDPEHADADTTLPKLIELAVVIKAIVDIEGYELPDGIIDTYALLANETSYIAVLAQIHADTVDYADRTLFQHLRVKTLGHELISEFPDFDGDGILDIDDLDRDDDGIQDADPKQMPYDFAPFDADIWGPRIEQINFVADDALKRSNDFHFANCIKQSITDAPPSTIDDVDNWTLVNAHDITELGCRGASSLIENGPLVYFINLEKLAMQDTGITDISSIAKLTKLVELDLSNTKITSAEHLTPLTQLVKLNLSRTSISSIAPLSQLTSLQELNLAKTDVDDIATLSLFDNLEWLDLSGSAVSDLSPLEGKQALTTLLASNANITVLPNFTTLPTLNKISLDGNGNETGTGLSDISNLAGLANFTELDLSKNNIDDLSVLANFTELTHLDVSYNNITDINALTDVNKLLSLNLSDNNITGIEVLANKVQLTSLQLTGNHVNSLVPLAEISQLTELHLVDNNITMLSGLENLLNLDSLQLDNNNITDVSIIKAWARLPAELDLSGNSISEDDFNEINNRAELQGTVFIADFDDRAIITGGPFKDQTIDFLFDLPEQGTSHRSSAPYHSIEEQDIIHCVESPKLDASICFESRQQVPGQALCSANENSQQMTCKEADEVDIFNDQTWYGTHFTIDFDQKLQPNNKFIAAFENRLLITLLRVNYAEVEIKCSALDPATQMSTCELNENLYNHEQELFPDGKNFRLEAPITWQQNHTQPFIPRCDGVQGDNIAMCYPVHGTMQYGDRQGKGQTDYSATPFAVDMSRVTILGVEESCPEGSFCAGH